MSEGESFEWENFPLFAPSGTSIPKFSEDDSAETSSDALVALSHILYDEETPLEASELLRDEGNRHFKRGQRGYKNAIKKYSEAIEVAANVPEALAPGLLNRAIAEFKLMNYGRALNDAERSLVVQPGQVKAHYWALLCGLRLEKFDIAKRHYEEGMKICEQDSPGVLRNKTLLKAQKKNLDAAIEKSRKFQAARQQRNDADYERKQSLEHMIRKRGITMGLPLFSQQRRYAVTEPMERDGEWFWPVLLVYPEEATCPGLGDQSDYLEDVSEQTTISEILDWVFSGTKNRPEWDVNRMYADPGNLEARYRTRWTMKKDEADSDDEEYFCGSTLPLDEIGGWVSVKAKTRLMELMRRPDYTTPLFPVLYVVPKLVNL